MGENINSWSLLLGSSLSVSLLGIGSSYIIKRLILIKDNKKVQINIINFSNTNSVS